MYKLVSKTKILLLFVILFVVASIFYADIIYRRESPDVLVVVSSAANSAKNIIQDYNTIPASSAEESSQIILENDRNLSNNKWEEPLAYECCTPLNRPLRKNVYYLKSHKTGSSTIQNIILRFALKYSLDVITVIYLTYRLPFSDLSMYQHTRTPNNKYHILAHHMRYTTKLKNYQYPNTAMITSMRHPVNLFQSLFNYFRINETVGMNFKEFLNVRRKPPIIANALQILFTYIGYNQMSHDLGFSLETNAKNQTAIEEFIAKIDREFDLVMITEYMDESLVLLANLMGWPLEYVAHLNINERPTDHNIYRDYVLTPREKLIVMDLNHVDAQLYHHFLQKFLKCVRQYGEDKMKRDAILLRSLNERLKEKCVKEKYVANWWQGYVKFIQYQPKNISDLECFYATRDPNQLEDIVIGEQFKRLQSQYF